MANFRLVVKRAWDIRRMAAVKFGCPVMEIVWGECFRQAQSEVVHLEFVNEEDGYKVIVRYNEGQRKIGVSIYDMDAEDFLGITKLYPLFETAKDMAVKIINS